MRRKVALRQSALSLSIKGNCWDRVERKCRFPSNLREDKKEIHSGRSTLKFSWLVPIRQEPGSLSRQQSISSLCFGHTQTNSGSRLVVLEGTGRRIFQSVMHLRVKVSVKKAIYILLSSIIIYYLLLKKRRYTETFHTALDSIDPKTAWEYLADFSNQARFNPTM